MRRRWRRRRERKKEEVGKGGRRRGGRDMGLGRRMKKEEGGRSQIPRVYV